MSGARDSTRRCNHAGAPPLDVGVRLVDEHGELSMMPLTNVCAQCGQHWVLTHVCPPPTAAVAPMPTPWFPVQIGQQDEWLWPKLTKPARVGAGTFGVGVSARLVVEAAQRQHEYAQEEGARTPEQAREHERERRKLWDMMNGSLEA